MQDLFTEQIIGHSIDRFFGKNGVFFFKHRCFGLFLCFVITGILSLGLVYLRLEIDP